MQTLLQCLGQARVILHSELAPRDRALTRTEHSDDLAATLDGLAASSGGAGRQGGATRLPIAILPLGPLSIPVLAAQATAAG